MSQYYFTTPYVEEGPIGKHRLFYFYKGKNGIAVKKVSGTYSTIRYPIDEDIQTYDEYYSGGHTHVVNAATRASLISANIGITSENFTEL
jgi:hypothetical protein